MAQKKTRAMFRKAVMSNKIETSLTISGGQVQAETFEANDGGPRPPLQDMIRHLYVHIPFCARICPYCAFYKELLDRSQTPRFCEAIVRELQTQTQDQPLRLTTIYFGGGTPTALTTAQLDFLLTGFHRSLDLSEVIEWTMAAT